MRTLMNRWPCRKSRSKLAGRVRSIGFVAIVGLLGTVTATSDSLAHQPAAEPSGISDGTTPFARQQAKSQEGDDEPETGNTQNQEPRHSDWSQKPGFLNLRYDEDYSFLDDHPEARRDDPRLYLKNIDLGGRWRMDLGGEFRLRVENRTNPYFGLGDGTSDTQQNYRWMLHANVRYGKLFRLFVQGIVAHVESQDGPFQPTQENHGDIHQLFIDVNPLGEQTPLTLRLGRQELNYGHDRMIGAFEWVSTRRRFDGVKVFYRSHKWDIDAFAVRPVRVQRTASDDWDDDYNFFGVYTTIRPLAGHGLDLYVFYADRSDQVENPNGHTSGRTVTTAGTRLWGKGQRWDYDIELAGQWGHWAGDSVRATFLEADVGYTLNHPWHPRLGTGFGWASGDDDPFDRQVGTWDQLFTYDHVCISFQDLIGRQNVTRYYAALEAWPTSTLKTSIFYHWYWLNEEKDYYYNSGASPVLRDLDGHSGRRLGSALELMLEYQMTANTSLMAVYSHFWDETFFHRVVGDDDDPDLLFIQFRYMF